MKSIILSALALAIANAQQILSCGSAPYFPSQYTCYDGFLCPIINGEATLKCDKACYLPESYKCVNSNLVQQNTPVNGSYSLAVINSGIAQLNGVAISACGQSFIVSGASCTYCPDLAITSGLCMKFSNKTIFSGSLFLNTMVPGGQQTYITPDGAIGYTQAHSAYEPPGATFLSVTAYSQGYLTAPPGASNWLACPDSSFGSWKIFAKLAGVTFNQYCIRVNLKVIDVPKGTLGAWQYT